MVLIIEFKGQISYFTSIIGQILSILKEFYRYYEYLRVLGPEFNIELCMKEMPTTSHYYLLIGTHF